MDIEHALVMNMNNYWSMGMPEGKTPLFDGPMFKIDMVNLQSNSDQKTANGGQIIGNSIIAGDYVKNKALPSYMEHLVGKVRVHDKPETHVVDGQERRVRGSGTWVVVLTFSERAKVRKGYIEPMLSPFTEEFFAIREIEPEDSEIVFNLGNLC